MSGVLLIRDLAVVMLLAGGVAWLCQRLHLSAVVGYLLAGMAIGPYTPPFVLVSDLDRVQTLAQLGLVFLIFSIGLSLSLNRLSRLGRSLIAATAVSAILVLNGGRLLGWMLGWSVTASLFLAAMLMVSSSAIIGKVLDELNLTHERPGQLALGMTVLEDAVAILMLTLLTPLARIGGSETPQLLPTLGALGAFVVLVAVLSLLLVPKLLARLSRQTTPELRTMAVAGLLLSLAWLAAWMGYSLALGAFVFGAIVGSTRYKADIERGFEGLRQVFGAVFFVAVGMQVDFKLLIDAWPLVLTVSAAALLLRPLACSLGFLVAGNTTQQSIQAGLFLTPLGEFSFIIALAGVESGGLPRVAYPVAVGASLVTSLVAPVLTRHAGSLSTRLARAEPVVVQHWVQFYHDWLAHLRDRQNPSLLWRLTRRSVWQSVIVVLVVSALILIADPLYTRVRAALAAEGLSPPGLPVAFWGVFGLILLAPLIALWRNIAALSLILAEAATQRTPRQQWLRPLLESALRAVAVPILAAWLLALFPSGLFVLGAAGAVLLMLALVVLAFRRRLIGLQTRLEIELREQLQRARQATATSAWSASLPAQSADWDLDIDEVLLPSDSACAGRTVGELALRRRFGCSLIGIDRHGFSIVNPRADTVLYPLDRLLLLGKAEELARAARTLGGTLESTDGLSGFDELTMETVFVPSDSPLAGRTLLELDLIRTAGVQIGGLRRGKHLNVSPSGHDRLDAGNELLVLGTPAQIKAFRARLTGPPTPSPAGSDAPAPGDHPVEA